MYNQVSWCFKTTGSDNSVCTILSGRHILMVSIYSAGGMFINSQWANFHQIIFRFYFFKSSRGLLTKNATAETIPKTLQMLRRFVDI